VFVRTNWHFLLKERFSSSKTERSVKRKLVDDFYFLYLLWKLNYQTCSGLILSGLGAGRKRGLDKITCYQ
jgi:hypothetical protein